MRVVAWEHAVAAPLATRHLADLGADVVKVERPGGGDFARAYDSAVRGLSAYFVWLNRGKRSVVLDLKDAEGRRAFDRLLDRADVFVHNQGPGAAERLGCAYADLKARNPRLVACSISGYGPDGPHRDRKAYDLLLQGEAGVIDLTGTPEAPAKIGISVADIASGMYAFSSILGALYQRRQDGRGRRIQISMLEALVEWTMPAAYVAQYTGHAAERAGTRHNFVVPYGSYRVGDGGSVNLAVQNDGQWRRLCAIVLRQPELADDPRFVSNELRLKNRAVLEPLIEQLLADERARASRRAWSRPTSRSAPSTPLRTCWTIRSWPPASAGSRSRARRRPARLPPPDEHRRPAAPRHARARARRAHRRGTRRTRPMTRAFA